jgi:hypothetical protein
LVTEHEQAVHGSGLRQLDGSGQQVVDCSLHRGVRLGRPQNVASELGDGEHCRRLSAEAGGYRSVASLCEGNVAPR